MADLDKVIKGLECCDKKYPRNAWCKYCPYEPDCLHDSTCDLLIHDALNLLRSQQAEIAELKEREKKHEHRLTVAELHEKYNSI